MTKALATGARVVRSAKFLRLVRQSERLGNPGTIGGGVLVGGDGGEGVIVGQVPGCVGMVFVLWDEEADCIARGINVANLALASRKSLDAHAAEHTIAAA